MSTIYRALVGSVAVAVTFVWGISARTQFDIPSVQDISEGLSELDPNKSGSQANQQIQNAGKVLADIDPSAAIRREYDEARKAAMSQLRRLDPTMIQQQVQFTLQQQIVDQLARQG